MVHSMASMVFAELQTDLAGHQVDKLHVQHKESGALRCECRDLKGLVVTVGRSEAGRVAEPLATLHLRQEPRT